MVHWVPRYSQSYAAPAQPKVNPVEAPAALRPIRHRADRIVGRVDHIESPVSELHHLKLGLFRTDSLCEIESYAGQCTSKPLD